MKILIITYSFLPHVSPRSLRWDAILSRWAEQGHEVEVICGAQGGNSGTFEENGRIVHRLGGGARKAIRSLLKQARKGDTDAKRRVGSPQKQSRSGWMFRVLKWVYSKTWGKLYWPDYACLWILPARRKIRNCLRTGSFDAVISVSPPFSGHMAVLGVIPSEGEILWMVDCGDPFSFADVGQFNNNTLYSKLNAVAEHRVFSKANLVSVTTDPTAVIYGELFPDIAHKIHVIPPLVNLPPFKPENQKQEEEENDDPVQLLYVGGFYRDVREPGSLIELAGAIQENSDSLRDLFELHVIGGLEGFEEEFAEAQARYSDVFHLHGRVSHDACGQAMGEADFLINIGNLTSYQLPSKVVEYAVTGLPILNITASGADSSSDFFSDYPLFLNIRHDAIKESIPGIEAFILESKGRRVAKEIADNVRSKHSAAVIADAYFDAIFGKE